ncbi:MAG: hypothetical protein ACK4UR_02930, partial [Caldimicrobium sp.]
MAEEDLEREEQKIEEKQEDTALNPEDLMAMWEEALKEAQSTSIKEETSVRGDFSNIPVETPPHPSAQPITFEELRTKEPSPSIQDIEFLLDVPLEI